MKRKYVLVVPALLICCLSYMGCEKSKETAVGLKDEPLDKRGFEDNMNTYLLLELINNIRTSGCNCKEEDGSVTKMPPVNRLRWSNDLAKIAQNHYELIETKENINRKYFNAKRIDERLADIKYHWPVITENFAMGQRTEKDALESWLNSTHGDCKNIMNPKVKEMAAAWSNDDIYSWTLLMAEK